MQTRQPVTSHKNNESSWLKEAESVTFSFLFYYWLPTTFSQDLRYLLLDRQLVQQQLQEEKFPGYKGTRNTMETPELREEWGIKKQWNAWTTTTYYLSKIQRERNLKWHCLKRLVCDKTNFKKAKEWSNKCTKSRMFSSVRNGKLG